MLIIDERSNNYIHHSSSPLKKLSRKYDKIIYNNSNKRDDDKFEFE